VNFEKSLYYVTHHSETIIQWLFLAVVVFGGLIVAGGIFKKKNASTAADPGAGSGGEQLTEIQAALQRLLAQTAKLENVSLSEAAPAVVADVDAQVKALRAELSTREAEIAALKASGAPGENPDAAASAASGLAERVKELEAKLAEYEILEDDIADLSLFKDENSRLKAELEALKTGGAVPAAVEPTPTVETPAADAGTDSVTSADLIVEEFAQVIQHGADDTGDEPAPAQEPVPAPAPAPAPVTAAPAATPAPAAPEPSLADLQSIPAKVVSNPFASTAPPAEATAAAPAPQDGEAAVKAEADDLFAEFAQETPPDEDSLDTGKMMAEMEALSNIEPSATDALEAAIDTDKMADEATSLSKS
jgi:hypothetical protein